MYFIIFKVTLALVIFIEERSQWLRLTVTKWPELMLTEHGLNQGLAACSLTGMNLGMV